MTALSLTVLALFSTVCVTTLTRAQDPSIGTWISVLRTANELGLSLVSDSKDMNILGHQCRWERKAGWFKWEVVFNGKISCGSIGKEYSHQHCKGRECAWKEPFMLLIKDFIANNRAPKDGLNEAIRGSNLSEQEKQNLLSLAG